MKDACQVCRDNDVTCGDASHLELSEPSRVDIDIFAPEYELSWSVTEDGSLAYVMYTSRPKGLERPQAGKDPKNHY